MRLAPVLGVFTVPPPMLPATRSVLTMVGGRIVHDDLMPSRSADARRR